MKDAIEEAKKTMNLGYGGPFGAMIKDKDGKIIAVASNTVLKDNDATAHAEVNAIRKACHNLGTYDLEGCTMYATGYPCPMCLAAVVWSNIKTIYYGISLDEAKKIGFRDDAIYNLINGEKSAVEIIQLDHDSCLTLFENYHNKIY